MNWLTAEFYRLYIAPSLPPLLIIIGWFFVSRDNDRRETRKEIRALLNEISKKLDGLYDDAMSYFCSIDNIAQSVEAQIAEVTIKQSLERIDSSLQILGKMEPRFLVASDKFEELTKAITGHPKFESRSQSTGIQEHSDFEMLRIALARSNLISCLEDVFVETHVRRYRCLDANESSMPRS